jgi:ATP-dependent Lon protease
VGNKSGKGDAGVVLLGNIPVDSMKTDVNMFSTLPPIFRESALIDRFHGFVEGWKIPRMNETMKANGWALNTELFSEILHGLRTDLAASGIVTELLVIPPKSDTRDVNAVKRIACAFMKLLFPHWAKSADVDTELFREYCLVPALNMRGIIKQQLCIIDREYLNYPLPDITIKENDR